VFTLQQNIFISFKKPHKPAAF